VNVLRILVALILTAVLLTGCGGSVVYNRLDWLIPWYVESYVDLSREQRQSLREQLEPLLQWHREEELARYQRILQRVELELAKPVTGQQVESWIEGLMQSTERIEQSLLKLSLEFGDTLSDEQIDEFVASLYEKQNELEEEFLSRSDADYVKENAENLEDMLGRFLGKINSQQKQRLHQAAREMQRFDATWLDDRRQWLDQLSELLKRQEGWQGQVMQAYRDREQDRPTEYATIVDHNIRVIAEAVADVFNSRTARQSKHTTNEFEDLRNLLEKLTDSEQVNAGASG